MDKDQFLKITYQDANAKTYTDILHPSELHVTKQWLDRVQSITPIQSGDRLEAFRKDKLADTRPNEIKGEAARNYLQSITNIYS